MSWSNFEILLRRSFYSVYVRLGVDETLFMGTISSAACHIVEIPLNFNSFEVFSINDFHREKP